LVDSATVGKEPTWLVVWIWTDAK